MTVTFCGHRDISFSIVNELERAIAIEVEKLIKEGANIFLLGGYGMFDTICAHAVKKLKNKYPHIVSILIVPYLNKQYPFRELFDDVEYPFLEKTPLRYAILKRNEYMVKKADVVVSFVQFNWGGSAKTLEYARKKGKTIIDIYKISGLS